MLSIAALALAAASAASSPALATTSPWWEKVTYTISGDGAQQSCRYESSVAPINAAICDSEDAPTPVRAAAPSSTGAYTRITIERRFTPGDRLDPGTLQPGDTLIGGRVMALAIDTAGVVRNCRTLAASGDVQPAYDCDEARAERFEASGDRPHAEHRVGFLSIIVYGHEAQVA